MSRNYEELGVIGVILGIVGIGFGIWQSKKTSDITNKLDISIDEFRKKTPVEVSGNIVNRAVKDAVKSRVDQAVSRSVNSVTSTISTEMNRKIRSDVDNVYDKLKSSVTKRVEDAVGKLDMDEMRSHVRKKAEEKVFEEFCKKVSFGKIFSFGDDDEDSNGDSLDLDGVSEILEQFDTDWDKQQALKAILARRSS